MLATVPPVDGVFVLSGGTLAPLCQLFNKLDDLDDGQARPSRNNKRENATCRLDDSDRSTRRTRCPNAVGEYCVTTPYRTNIRAVLIPTQSAKS